MPLEFTYDMRSPRVVFGVGAVQRLTDEIARLGTRRVLVLCTPGRGATVEQVAAQLGARVVGVFARARMHVPLEVVDAATAEAERAQADLCVCVGGGSAIGLAKAIALRSGLPYLAIPTTYAGSEMTSIWGISAGGNKTTGRDPRVVPRTVVYDPMLTISLPPHVSGPSGMNAIAHCVEALYAPDANPVTSILAEEGIRALGEALPAVVRHPGDVEARTGALYGAWLAGMSLAGAAMGLHHRICHTLGGSYDLPHAETHAVVLPHVVAYNRPATPAAVARIARALRADDAATALLELASGLGCPTSLRQIGLKEMDLDGAAARVVETPYSNPRAFDGASVRALLSDAYHGRSPFPQ